MNSYITVSPQQLRRAADVKERIDALQNELARLLGTPAPQQSTGNTGGGGRVLSAASRARIAAAARKRWANARRNTPSATPKKRVMSAAARAHLASIARARWRSAKAAGKKAL